MLNLLRLARNNLAHTSRASFSYTLSKKPIPTPRSFTRFAHPLKQDSRKDQTNLPPEAPDLHPEDAPLSIKPDSLYHEKVALQLEKDTQPTKDDSLDIDPDSLPVEEDCPSIHEIIVPHKEDNFFPSEDSPGIDPDSLPLEENSSSYKEGFVSSEEDSSLSMQDYLSLQNNSISRVEDSPDIDLDSLPLESHFMPLSDDFLPHEEEYSSLEEDFRLIGDSTKPFQKTTLSAKEPTLSNDEVILSEQKAFTQPEGTKSPLTTLVDPKHVKFAEIKRNLESIIIPSNYQNLYEITEHYHKNNKHKVRSKNQLEQAEPAKKELPSITRGDPALILKTIEKEIIASGFNDNSQILNILLEAQVKTHSLYPAFTTFKNVLGLKQLPHLQTTTSLAKLAARFGEKLVIFDILDAMEKYSVSPNQEIYESLIEALNLCKEPEHAYLIYEKMVALKFVPSKRIANLMAQNLVRDNEEELAYNLVTYVYSNNAFLMPGTLLFLLRSFSHKNMAKPTFDLWNKCIEVIEYGINEGDCLLVLATAARSGNPNLAADVLRVLDKKGFSLLEYHLEPLFESFVEAEDWGRAIETLHIMRSSNMGLSKASVIPITHKLANISSLTSASSALAPASSTPESVFQLFMAHIKEYPLALDVKVVNALLRSLVLSNQAHIALTKSTVWFESAGFKKNSDTIAILLEGCLKKKNTFAAKNVFDTMLQEDIIPTQTIYEHMILTALTQTDYEDAFVYLEAMKAKGFVPNSSAYSALAIKCEKFGDPRFEAVVEEMKLYGYPIVFGYNRFHGSNYKIYTNNKNPQ